MTPEQTQPAPAPEQQTKYEVRQGDTLWDIANAFYRDPFLWPLIWKSNPSIVDPDLIYPGNALIIPSLAPVERAMSAPEEKIVEQAPAAPGTVQTATSAAVAPEETASIFRQKPLETTQEMEVPAPGSTLIMPEEGPAPIIDKFALLRAGFISEESSQDYLEGSVEDTAKGSETGNLVSFDQEVYIVVRSREAVNPGDQFIIFEEVHDVKHPITGKRFGKLYKVNGVLRVTKPAMGANEKGVYMARIIMSFEPAVRGNMLAPYQEPTLIYPSAQKETKNLTGHILEVTDRQSLVGQTYIVYLDKGKEDGVAPGDRFTVMSEPSPQTGARRPIGEVQVYVVKERTATAIVRKSADTMSKGYPIEFKN
jgi:LysM repeat protein